MLEDSSEDGNGYGRLKKEQKKFEGFSQFSEEKRMNRFGSLESSSSDSNRGTAKKLDKTKATSKLVIIDGFSVQSPREQGLFSAKPLRREVYFNQPQTGAHSNARPAL